MAVRVDVECIIRTRIYLSSLDNWEVVALHHSGSPYPPEAVADKLRKAWKGRFRVNEGIPMRSILAEFRTKGIDRHLPRS